VESDRSGARQQSRAVRCWGAGALKLLLALGLGLSGPSGADAQSSGDALDPGRLGVSVMLRSGIFMPTAEGGVFELAARDLTFQRGDLRGVSLGAEVAIQPLRRIQIHAAVDMSRSSAESIARKAPDGNSSGSIDPSGTQAAQVTTLDLVLVPSAGLRVFVVAPSGLRSHSDSPWLSGVSVFVSGGGGYTEAEFHQSGTFLDGTSGIAFQGEFTSAGRGRMGYLGGGLETPGSSRVQLTAELRKEWATTPLGGAWATFERLDVSGARLFLGLSHRW